ncbi:UDP-3-O-[3-hydroxymyristoyl] N-acetylglucosamine deacetylase [Bdellovibrio bacteriovorus]|uniref:UDP-3-O-acyl-N-acetylglucosamine deacetylase n=1 Tax=Bdellovibrio bacteriovorus TaxID=959 RepID=A0A162GBM6_BDEBC|nr:UDP-3-O-acyl-N-acetylglucosamine deacetylase [Bdellovibrio bacteriovorus]KYG67743.1 UDP-3-O-[3-hydroxymyristoyl] N-acetylglucosamine deacetylase [Bdellovibrio bacteriovorus]
MFLQKTIRKKTVVNGIGIHSGDSCTLTFRPAPPDTGVYFIRTDLPGNPSLKVTARNVQATSHQTTIGGAAFSVATIEHCLSALSALRIDNLFIELDGPEIPIGDGSARDFLQALLAVGIVEQDQPRKYCYITEPIYFSEGEKHAYVVPYHGLRLTVTIDFPHPKIGKQTIDIDINEQSFGRDVANARTFGFMKDVEALKARGLAKGGSLDNCIVLDHAEIINPEGLRWADEFVRHKALDALGDLVTLEMPLMGHVVLYKAGHDIMNKLVKKVWDSPTSYRHVELGADISEEVQRYSGWTVPL